MKPRLTKTSLPLRFRTKDGNFFIEVAGYEFLHKFSGLTMVAHRSIFLNNVHGDQYTFKVGVPSNEWKVTEKSTGLSVCIGTTLKEVLETAEEKINADNIEQTMDNVMKNVAPAVNPLIVLSLPRLTAGDEHQFHWNPTERT